MPTRTLSRERGGHEAGVRVRTLGPEGSGLGSHIDWRGKRVPTRMLGIEGGGL